MPIQHLIFYVFAFIAVTAAVMVVTSNNPVRCVLSLVLTFFASAGIWMLAEAEFLALVLILVYVGAVMTLFLFVIMMLDINLSAMRRRFVKYVPIGAGIVGLLVLLMLMAVKPEHFGFTHLTAGGLHGANYSDVSALGMVLYTKYLYPFELAAVLLLVAIVAAISLAHRGPRECHSQNAVKQIRVRREDRVRLVSMPATRAPGDMDGSE